MSRSRAWSSKSLHTRQTSVTVGPFLCARCIRSSAILRGRFSDPQRRSLSTSSSTEPPNGNARSRGSYTRVLSAFAVGIPLGWLIHAVNDTGRKDNSTADFVPYTLLAKEYISSTLAIFTLGPATSAEVRLDTSKFGRAITSVQFKQPQLQIARSYTTLPALEGQDARQLRFLIRQERNGEVSGYLHRLPEGSEVELRGPFADFALPEDVKAVVFLAGGTGIAPALQVAEKLKEKASVHILWANRHGEDSAGGISDTLAAKTTSGWNLLSWLRPSQASPSDLPTSDGTVQDGSAVVSHLRSLKARSELSTQETNRSLKVDYYVDEQGTFIKAPNVLQAADELSQVAAGSGERLLIVSGPEGFVKHWAGPKQWLKGREVQGPLGGALAQMEISGWNVVKL